MGRNTGFLPFKDKHAGESAILFASGPTLSDFCYEDLPPTIGPQAGVNSVVYSSELHLDYYFCAHNPCRDGLRRKTLRDPDASTDYLATAVSRDDVQQIFVGTKLNDGVNIQYFTGEEAEEVGGIPYGLTTDKGPDAFTLDICNRSLVNHSIVFSSLQFLLFTGVHRIYLVGNDCEGGYSFIFPDESSNYDRGRHDLVPFWEDFSRFLRKELPQVEIVSINPRKLKGMFTDLWTK